MFEPFSLYAVGPSRPTAAARSAAVVLFPLLAETRAVVRPRASSRSASGSSLSATVPPTTPPCPRRAGAEAAAARRPAASAPAGAGEGAAPRRRRPGAGDAGACAAGRRSPRRQGVRPVGRARPEGSSISARARCPPPSFQRARPSPKRGAVEKAHTRVPLNRGGLQHLSLHGEVLVGERGFQSSNQQPI